MYSPLSHSVLLNALVKDLLDGSGALLGYSLLVALVVDVGHAESRLVAFGPLEVTIQMRKDACQQELSRLKKGAWNGDNNFR